MNINERVAQNIKYIRESKNLSQSDLAKNMGVDRSYISALESGSRNPSLETVASLAEALGVKIGEILESSKYSNEHSVLPYVPNLTRQKENEWKKKEWYHQRFDGSMYLMHMIAEAEILTHRNEKHGLYFDKHFCFYDDGKADWYIDMEEIKRISSLLIAKGKEDPHFSRTLMNEYKPYEKAFYDACKKVEGLNLYKLSNSELIEAHDEFLQNILNRNSSSSIIDGFALGTDRILEAKIKDAYEAHPTISKKYAFTEVFSILTNPEVNSFVQEAELELFGLIVNIQKNPQERKALIEDYKNRYFWIKNNYVDSYVLPIGYFEEEIGRIQSSHLNVEEEIKRIEQAPSHHRKQKTELLKDLHLDKETIFLLEVTEDFTHWQDERKKATLFTAHYSLLLLDEISRRLNIPADLLKCMSPREISKIFTDTPPVYMLQGRKKSSVAFWDISGHEIVSGGEVESIRNEVLGEKDLMDVQDFRGMTASRGKAEGYVKIIKSVKEIDRVNEGDVLVTVMTRPDYVPAMRKAVAIVTDEGGITSHAAIVSRELKIPCVIGTKISTRVLRDGDYVQVNANHGVVKILKRASE